MSSWSNEKTTFVQLFSSQGNKHKKDYIASNLPNLVRGTRSHFSKTKCQMQRVTDHTNISATEA